MKFIRYILFLVAADTAILIVFLAFGSFIYYSNSLPTWATILIFILFFGILRALISLFIMQICRISPNHIFAFWAFNVLLVGHLIHSFYLIFKNFETGYTKWIICISALYAVFQMFQGTVMQKEYVEANMQKL